jgi:hypothetical protein
MLKRLWRQFVAPRVLQWIEARFEHTIDQKIRDAIEADRANMRGTISSIVESQMDIVHKQKPWKENLYIPDLDIHPKVDGPFMVYSTCAAADFFHSNFGVLCSN